MKRKSNDEIPAKIKRTRHDEPAAKENSTAAESVIDLAQDPQIEQMESESSSNVSKPKSSTKLPNRLLESVLEHGAEMDPDTLPPIK